MCERCPNLFTIHDVEELERYVFNTIKVSTIKESDIMPTRRKLVKVWHKRQYFTNLIYLEYLEKYGRL